MAVQHFILTNMLSRVRFLSLPNLSNQMTANNNGGPKTATKTESKSDMIRRGFLTDMSISVNSDFDETFPNVEFMLNKIGFDFDESFSNDCRRKPIQP